MSIIQVQSDNPNFSWLTGKNPSSGVQIREIRRGKAFGWFSGNNNQSYNIYFKDSDVAVSYSDKWGEFEYLDTTRYNSALFPVNAIQDFLSLALKVNEQDVVGHTNKVVINMMVMKNLKHTNSFKKALPDYDLEVTELAQQNYRVTLTTKTKTMRELLSYTQLFCMFHALKNGDPLIINDDIIGKYLNVIKLIDPPYFLRYAFKCAFLNHGSLFKKYAKQLETTGNNEEIHFEYGHSFIARLRFAERILQTGRGNIVDIGCGDGALIDNVWPQLQNTERNYIGIDVDDNAIFKTSKKLRNRVSDGKLTEEQSSLFSSVDEYFNNSSKVSLEDSDMVLIEVIEHMTQTEAEQLIDKCMEQHPMRIIITTPNKDFNTFYAMEPAEMRHDDHKFEFTKVEFVDFMSRFTELEYTHTYYDIGDSVNGISSTVAVVLTKN